MTNNPEAFFEADSSRLQRNRGKREIAPFFLLCFPMRTLSSFSHHAPTFLLYHRTSARNGSLYNT
jgi:hypothetical protein